MPIERHLPRIYRLLVGINRVFILDYTRDPAGDRIKPAVETDSLGGCAPHTMPATWGPCCTTPVVICDTWRTFTVIPVLDGGHCLNNIQAIFRDIQDIQSSQNIAHYAQHYAQHADKRNIDGRLG